MHQSRKNCGELQHTVGTDTKSRTVNLEECAAPGLSIWSVFHSLRSIDSVDQFGSRKCDVTCVVKVVEWYIVVHFWNMSNETQQLRFHIFWKFDCLHCFMGIIRGLWSIFDHLRHFVDHNMVTTSIDPRVFSPGHRGVLRRPVEGDLQQSFPKMRTALRHSNWPAVGSFPDEYSDPFRLKCQFESDFGARPLNFCLYQRSCRYWSQIDSEAIRYAGYWVRPNMFGARLLKNAWEDMKWHFKKESGNVTSCLTLPFQLHHICPRLPLGQE